MEGRDGPAPIEDGRALASDGDEVPPAEPVPAPGSLVEPRLEIGPIKSGYTEVHLIDGKRQRVHWVVKNTQEENFNHCKLCAALHYAIPGCPPLVTPTAEEQQPFSMYQQISLDGRDCVCDFRFRILSSQHRNAKFVLRFWLVRIQSGEPVKGLEVKSEPFSFVSKKRQIETKRTDDGPMPSRTAPPRDARRSGGKRARRRAYGFDDGDDEGFGDDEPQRDGDGGDDEDAGLATDREEDERDGGVRDEDADYERTTAAASAKKARVVKPEPRTAAPSFAFTATASSAAVPPMVTTPSPRLVVAPTVRKAARRDPAPEAMMHPALLSSPALQGGEKKHIIVVDQSLHARMDTLEELLGNQRRALDHIVSSLGGARPNVAPDAAAAEAIAALSAPPTPFNLSMASLPDLSALAKPPQVTPSLSQCVTDLVAAFRATPTESRGAAMATAVRGVSVESLQALMAALSAAMPPASQQQRVNDAMHKTWSGLDSLIP